MSKFKAEDRVAREITERHDRLKRGKVLSVEPNGKLLVEWDELGWRQTSKIERVDESGLVTEAEAEAAHNKLEAEFEALSDKVQEKLEEAAKLIREAGKIASDGGESLHDMYEVTEPLINAMDFAGWNTSSWSC